MFPIFFHSLIIFIFYFIIVHDIISKEHAEQIVQNVYLGKNGNDSTTFVYHYKNLTLVNVCFRHCRIDIFIVLSRVLTSQIFD